MITGNIKDCEKYYGVHKDFEAVFECLKKISKDSEKYVIKEGDAWVNAPITPKGNGKNFEAHKKFIDIHYIISGSEVFGYSEVNRLEVTKEFDVENDYELLTGKVNEIELLPGDFVITFPEDAHIPTMKNNPDVELVRVVAKVKVD